MAAGPGPASWSRRLLRIAGGLLVLGGIGLVAGIAMLMIVDSDSAGDHAASSSRFVPVQGDAEITIEDEGLLGLFYDPAGPHGAPSSSCRVTDPQGVRLQQADGTIQSPVIDGTAHRARMGFETTGPGVYTVECAEAGYVAGPAYRTSERAPGLSGIDVGAVLLVVGTALLLSTLPVVPLLLAALIVRLVQGRREETPARRRHERWLTLLVACPVAGVALCVLDLVTVVAGLLDPERADADLEPFLAALMTLPVLMVLLLLTVFGVLRWRRGPS